MASSIATTTNTGPNNSRGELANKQKKWWKGKRKQRKEDKVKILEPPTPTADTAGSIEEDGEAADIADDISTEVVLSPSSPDLTACTVIRTTAGHLVVTTYEPAEASDIGPSPRDRECFDTASGENEECIRLETELKEFLNFLEGELPIRATLTAQEKTNKIWFVDSKMKQALTVLMAYKLELRETPTPRPPRLVQYEEKFRLYGQMLFAEKALADMDLCELEEANRTQLDSLQSLGRSKATMNETIQIGIATSEQLAVQSERMEIISGDLDDTGTLLKRANVQLRGFVRRMAGDKVIAGLLCVVCLAVIAAVIVRIVKGDPSALSKTDVFTGSSTASASTASTASMVSMPSASASSSATASFTTL